MKKHTYACLGSLLLVLVVAFIGTIALAFQGEGKLEERVNTAEQSIVNDLNSNFNEVELAVDILTSEASLRFREEGVNCDKEMQERILSELYQQFVELVNRTEYISNCYFHLSEEVAGDGTTGFYFSRVGSSLVNFSITDITAFDKDDLAHVGWYYIPLNYGYGVWLDSYENLNTDEYIISYGCPVYVDDTVIGVVGIDLKLDYFADQLEEIRPFKNSKISIYDRSRTEIAKAGDVVAYADNIVVSSNLNNNMTLVMTVAKSETQQINRSVLYWVLLAFYLIAFILTVSYLLWLFNQNSAVKEYQLNYGNYSEKTEEEKKAPKIDVVAVIFVIIALLMIQIGTTFFAHHTSSNEAETIVAENTFDETLHVVADMEFEPFSYLDEDGEMVGFDVDIINEIANRIGFNVELQLLDWKDCLSEITNGNADVILSYEIINNTDKVTTQSTDSIVDDAFVFYGKKPINSILDLSGKKIAQANESNILEIYGLTGNEVVYTDYVDVMKALEEDRVDYILIRKTVAEWILSEYNYDDVFEVYDVMESQRGIGVAEGKEEVLTQIQKAVNQMRLDGTLTAIYDKWLSNSSEDRSLGDAIVQNRFLLILTGIPICICLLLLFVTVIRGQKMVARDLKYRSENDGLTGILNRSTGEKRIRELLQEQVPGMFIIFDVDKFKNVNDTFGHAVGDQVLIAVADVMREVFRERDVILRLGGDEFAAFAPRVIDEETGARILERLFERMEKIHIQAMGEEKPTISVGTAFFFAEGEQFEDIYREADQKLYISKTKTGNYYTF